MAEEVMSTVAGEQTRVGLLITRFVVGFMVIVAVPDCTPEHPADDETPTSE